MKIEKDIFDNLSSFHLTQAKNVTLHDVLSRSLRIQFPEEFDIMLTNYNYEELSLLRGPTVRVLVSYYDYKNSNWIERFSKYTIWTVWPEKIAKCL